VAREGKIQSLRFDGDDNLGCLAGKKITQRRRDAEAPRCAERLGKEAEEWLQGLTPIEGSSPLWGLKPPPPEERVASGEKESSTERTDRKSTEGAEDSCT
jgi:hypothetical protein